MKPQTREDLARMAAHIDRTASDRYDRLAQEMALCGKTDVADTLRRLAEDKRRRLREIGDGDASKAKAD